MAKPVITQPNSPRTIARGVAILPLALVASGDPDSWAASPLPSGVSLDPDTGIITGTPATAGLVSTSITATNGDGTSAPVTLVWNIQEQPVGAGAWSDVELDFDLIERTVGIPGVEREAGEPVFVMARGDKLNLLVGLKKFGVLRDVQPGSEDVTLKLALKEYEPEIVLTLAGGTPAKVGSGDTARFRIPVWLSPQDWQILSDYETDKKTIMHPVAELELAVGTPVALDDKSATPATGISIQGGMSSEPITGALAVAGLTQFGEATPMRLTVTMTVVGRPLQTVELVRTFDLAWSGEGEFLITNLSGPTTGQGAAEGGKWRASLEITNFADGGAGEVDVGYSITTTDDASPPWVAIGGVGVWVDFSTSHQVFLYDSEGSVIGTAMSFGASGWDAESRAQDIETEWETQTGAADVLGVTWDAANNQFIVELTEESPVVGIEVTLSSISEPTEMVTGGGTAGLATTCAVAARIEQIENVADQPLRYTAQFTAGVIRDMVEDG